MLRDWQGIPLNMSVFECLNTLVNGNLEPDLKQVNDSDISCTEMLQKKHIVTHSYHFNRHRNPIKLLIFSSHSR